MKFLIKSGRAFYAAALLVYGVQQFYFGSFRNVFVSPYQNYLPLLNVLAYLFGAYLIITGCLIIIGRNGKKAALIFGTVLLILFAATQLTYELVSEPNKICHLGLWTNPLKELALAGGAFVVAGSFGKQKSKTGFLEKIIPYGNLFFLFTMISFGIAHFFYAQFLFKLLLHGCPIN